MQQRGVAWQELPEAELDWWLAEHVLEFFEAGEGDGRSGLAAAACLIAAVSKQSPRAHFRTAWKMLDVWRQRVPPIQAPAMTKTMVLALAGWLVVAQQPAVAFVVYICFAFLLRVGEALALTRATFVSTKTGFVAILGRSKRGQEQKVTVASAAANLWLGHCLRRLPRSGRLAAISYGKVAYWVRKGMEGLGFGGRNWTTHGLRRGGASELVAAGWPLESVMLHGRWLSLRSCREYIRRGEAALTRARGEFTEETWRKAEALAAQGPALFDFVKGEF